MSQTRIESFVEACVSIASGFVVSLVFWTFVIVPVYGLPVSMGQNLQIAGLFTILSVTRSYVWRRFFNAEVHKSIHRFLRRSTAWNQYYKRLKGWFMATVARIMGTH